MCQQSVTADSLRTLCPACEKPLLACYDLSTVRQTLNREDTIQDEPNLWRYRRLLPIQNARYIVSLGEGFTPLLHARRLAHELEFSRLFIKDEAQNPTGSFKARGLCVAVSRAYELGVTAFSIPSAGNAAGALSAYAALAGIPAHVFMPQDVPSPFVAECRAQGANITLVDGLITDCGRIAAEEVQRFDRFDVSTLKEPYRLEGKKTMGYEIAEQMHWKLPDVIVYPTGGGTGLIGMWKAFDEMEQLGWIASQRPRMVAVQAQGCAPIVRAFRQGHTFAKPWSQAHTIADGLRVPAAIGDFIILRILRQSNGTAISVSDQEIISASKLVGRTQGLFVCPEGAATVAAFRQLLSQSWIHPDETVVLFNTGSGLKYTHLWQK
jgi:threonine synthase